MGIVHVNWRCSPRVDMRSTDSLLWGFLSVRVVCKLREGYLESYGYRLREQLESQRDNQLWMYKEHEHREINKSESVTDYTALQLMFLHCRLVAAGRIRVEQRSIIIVVLSDIINDSL